MKNLLKIVVVLLIVVAVVAAWLGLGMNDAPTPQTVSKEIQIQ